MNDSLTMIKLFYASYILLSLLAATAGGYLLYIILMRKRITALFNDISQVREKNILYPPLTKYASLNGTCMQGKVYNRDFLLSFKKGPTRRSSYLVFILSTCMDTEFMLYNKNAFKNVKSGLDDFLGPDISIDGGMILKSKDNNIRTAFLKNEKNHELMELLETFTSIILSNKSFIFSKSLLTSKDLKPGVLSSYLSQQLRVIHQLEEML